MITDQAASIAVSKLSVLPYFPADKPARAMIINLLTRMVSTDEQLDWLVERTCDLWSKWEGIRELRALYCARFKPKDGVEINYSGVFPDGIVPPEKPLPQFRMLPLPDGRLVTADEALDRRVVEIAQRKAIRPTGEMTPAERNEAQKFDQMLQEITTGPPDRKVTPMLKPFRESKIVKLSYDRNLSPPAVPPQEITAADIEHAIAEKKNRREEMIQQAQQTAGSKEASEDQKLMAREMLRGFGLEEES